MLYAIMAVPMPTAGSLDELVAHMENAILPSLKMVAIRERKKKLGDTAIVSEAVTVIMAEFQSRAEANRSVMSLRSAEPEKSAQGAISWPAHGPGARKALQQLPVRPVPRAERVEAAGQIHPMASVPHTAHLRRSV